ncbi:MAG TPA: site-2 protease family protein [Verrucomicrobiae bacterium]|nr:site-2 protease family protein [Verrucomicrobiae bacterium]
MDTSMLSVGLAQYLCVVIIITFHEFGHAWMASRCGDDTARHEGRVTLNPLAHIDPIGTVLLPLLALWLTLGGQGKWASLIIGWGRPVPVNPFNLRHRVRDDILVSMAGPAMNVALSVLAVVIWRIGAMAGSEPIASSALMLIWVSMFLFFFNLIPVPPLDGSHVMKHVVQMPDETFLAISRFGMYIVIVLMQIPGVQDGLGNLTFGSIRVLRWFVGF